jgi:hypothetical protein
LGSGKIEPFGASEICEREETKRYTDNDPNQPWKMSFVSEEMIILMIIIMIIINWKRKTQGLTNGRHKNIKRHGRHRNHYMIPGSRSEKNQKKKKNSTKKNQK